MATPHNTAEKGQIAKTVLMPGDPLRAKFIAETYLEKTAEFNHVRGMLGYTGSYKGKPVSVMGSGMGMPSIGIYSWELYTQYDVENIIRIGSAGGYADSLRLFDVVLVTEAYSESTYARCQSGFTGNVIKPSEALCGKLRQSAGRLGVPLVEGRTHSSDVFYYQLPGEIPAWQQVRDKHNCIVVEMESFALFHNAAVSGKNAACLLTISDVITNRQVTTPEEREKRFTRMMEIALGVL
ncbi:MAG: purine-nucleoside phosphorylase [Spirochaetaceae bacterium]|jgi:purine-nucleoside phosphorylase|nr:purine-nucleoside phosphorylase [Spirochaetaceae bacterium]